MIFKPDEILAELVRGGVDFIVIGGVAGLLRTSSLLTQDLDIVHRRTPENVERLLAIIEKLDGYFPRTSPGAS